VSRTMRRLLSIREMEEEQRRLALESAMGEFHRLEDAMKRTLAGERRGRGLVAGSAWTGQLTDRLAGVEESRAAVRQSVALKPAIKAKEEEVGALRQQFHAKRVERRQAESLVEAAAAKFEFEAKRRSQQSVDDWFNRKLHWHMDRVEGRGAAAAEVEETGRDDENV